MPDYRNYKANPYCKKTLFTILLAISIVCSNAQTEYIVTVNPATGIPTKIDSIPGVTWLRGHYISAYCESTRHYTFVGGDAPNGNPFYLITVDAITGQTLSNPLFPDHLKFFSLQYSNATNTLYGITKDQTSGIISLVTVNTSTATYSLVKELPGLSTAIKLLIDDTRHYFIIEGADMTGRCIQTIDMTSGALISQIFIPMKIDLLNNRLTGKFYMISVKNPVFPETRLTYSLCSIDPISAVVTDLAVIPNLGVISSGDETLDENGGRYFFLGSAWGDTTNYLYTLNINNGQIIHKSPIPARNIITEDNLIQFRYDNIQGKLYGLLWEAKTIYNPPIVIDSTCRLDIQTKVFPNPFTNSLFIDKAPTVCKTSLNIYNAIGQLVIRNEKVNDGRNEYDLSFLSGGVYFYEFISNDKVLLSGKVLKQ